MVNKLDLEFNKIIQTEIFNDISKAFNSLSYETRNLSEKDEIINKKASHMKSEINTYIDWQVSRLTQER